VVLDDGFVPVVVCGMSAVGAATLLHVCSPCFHCWWHGASSSVRPALYSVAASLLEVGVGISCLCAAGLFLQSLPQRGSIYHIARERGG
jgi:hypothetical protein